MGNMKHCFCEFKFQKGTPASPSHMVSESSDRVQSALSQAEGTGLLAVGQRTKQQRHKLMESWGGNGIPRV